MLLCKDDVKRCGIFLFFDKDGKADKYVINMLEDLKKSIDDLIVVVNGFLDDDSRIEMMKHADDIICRANVGFDVGGYREGLFYLGWERLARYDEVVLFNYTFFGPIYPFEEMFEKMKSRDVSFWGITKHMYIEIDPFNALPYDFLPEHIQSHFLVLRNDLVTSYYYKDFIYNMKNPSSYIDSIVGYEAIFTKYFEDLGFKWDVYVDVSKYEGYSYNPHMFYITELLEEERCPIIKRRSFFTDFQDFLSNTCGEASVKMYAWLKKNRPEYLELIWDNLLRLENMSGIHKALGLNYIHESYATDYSGNKKTALAIILEDTKKLVFYKRYLKSLPDYLDIIVYGREEDKEKISMIIPETSFSYIKTENIDYRKALSDLCEKCRISKWEYVGITYIKNLEVEKPYSNLVSSEYSDWNNLFLNKNVIGNIINTFEDNNRLGMLMPPVPDYGTHVQKDYGFVPVGGSFWIRGNCLEMLKPEESASTEEFINSVVTFVQKLGEYTGISYSDSYYSVAYTNESYKLRENNKAVFEKFGAEQLPIVLKRITEKSVKNDN